MRKIVLLTLVSITLLFSGCTEKEPEESSWVEQPQKTQPTTLESKMKENRFALIETSKGTIKLELFEQRAPTSTGNFIDLSEKGFYKDMVFHRVVPGFVIQTGDSTGSGSGGSGKTIPLETHPELKHDLGAVGMARSNDPNSATSQFYIVIGEADFLNGKYAVFGKVVEGMGVAQKIQQGDAMKEIKIVTE